MQIDLINNIHTLIDKYKQKPNQYKWKLVYNKHNNKWYTNMYKEVPYYFKEVDNYNDYYKKITELYEFVQDDNIVDMKELYLAFLRKIS